MVAENALEVAAKDGHWVILQVSPSNVCVCRRGGGVDVSPLM